MFQAFTYHRVFSSEDGKNLKGIDMTGFDEKGQITFEVMIRPMSALEELGEEMGKRLAPCLS